MSDAAPGGLLDVVMIVKNEEHHLPASLEALLALRPLVGEIHVYDTGSTDGTVELCRRFGCQVVEGYWDDDFARARNAAAAASSAAWHLHIDADEVVTADQAMLRRCLVTESGGVDVLYFSIQSWDRGRVQDEAVIGRLLRAGTTKFIGRVHEHAGSLSGRGLVSRVLPVEALMVAHSGYGGEGTMERKAERNLVLSHAEVEACRQPPVDESELQLALIHRARAYGALGRYEEMAADLQEVRALPTNLGGRRYAGELLVDRSLMLGDVPRALTLLSEVMKEGSGRQWCTWRLAMAMSCQDRHQEAWDLIRTVGHVFNGLGEALAPGALVADQTRFAFNAGETEQAVAAALVAVTRYGRMELIPFLVAAFEGLPAEMLARLLHESGSVFSDEIGTALRAQNEHGELVADVYRSLAREDSLPLGSGQRTVTLATEV